MSGDTVSIIQDDSRLNVQAVKNSAIEVIFVNKLIENYAQVSPINQEGPMVFSVQSSALVNLGAKIGALEGDYRKLFKKFLLALVIGEVSDSEENPYGEPSEKLAQKLNELLNIEFAAETQRLDEYKKLFNKFSFGDETPQPEFIDEFLALVSALEWPVLNYL